MFKLSNLGLNMSQLFSRLFDFFSKISGVLRWFPLRPATCPTRRLIKKPLTWQTPKIFLRDTTNLCNLYRCARLTSHCHWPAPAEPEAPLYKTSDRTHQIGCRNHSLHLSMHNVDTQRFILEGRGESSQYRTDILPLVAKYSSAKTV